MLVSHFQKFILYRFVKNLLHDVFVFMFVLLHIFVCVHMCQRSQIINFLFPPLCFLNKCLINITGILTMKYFATHLQKSMRCQDLFCIYTESNWQQVSFSMKNIAWLFSIYIYFFICNNMFLESNDKSGLAVPFLANNSHNKSITITGKMQNHISLFYVFCAQRSMNA
jgi:hypothetical protein